MRFFVLYVIHNRMSIVFRTAQFFLLYFTILKQSPSLSHSAFYSFEISILYRPVCTRFRCDESYVKCNAACVTLCDELAVTVLISQ